MASQRRVRAQDADRLFLTVYPETCPWNFAQPQTGYFCSMIFRCLLFLLLASLLAEPALSQNSDRPDSSAWDLKKCIDYAMVHNISVRRADVQARLAGLDYAQSKLSQLPSVNLQNSAGYQFGRSIDPTSNQFTNAEILFANHSVNIGMDLFNWFSKRNLIEYNKYTALAGLAGGEKARNDIALNVANAYLQILLNEEQIKISEVQVKQSIEQVRVIGIQVKAGSLPELNLAEMETQLANDSSTLITNQSNYILSILQLKAILNIPADQAFDVAIPPVETIPIEPLSELDPAAVYKIAEVNMPQQKINDLNLQAARKNVLAVRGRMYPNLTLFGGLDSRYSNAQSLYVKSFVSTTVPIGIVSVNGNNYTVNSAQQQAIPIDFGKNTYFRQINNNFSQSAGVALSVQIFNGGVSRTNWRKAQLSVENVALQKENDALTLKQDIYQAYTNAVAALQKFNASQKGVASSQKAYDFAKARFDIGLLNSLDLILNQNNLFRAKINLVLAQYDYVFKMKLLEFYRGQGLKL